MPRLPGHQFRQERGPGAEGHQAVQRERLGRPEGRGGGAGRLPGHGDPAAAGVDPGRLLGKRGTAKNPRDYLAEKQENRFQLYTERNGVLK